MPLVSILCLSKLGCAMTGRLDFFFVQQLLLASDLFGLYIAAYYLSAVLGISIRVLLSRKKSKAKAVLVAVFWFTFFAMLVPVVAITPQSCYDAFEIPRVLAWLPAEAHQVVVDRFEGTDTGKFLFFIILMCGKGSAVGAFSAIPASMAADVIDVDTAQTGLKRAGAYFSIWSMTRKMAFALGVTIGTTIVTLSGFDSLADPLNTTNSWLSLMVLTVVYSLLTPLSKIRTVPLLLNYSLSG